MAVEGVWFDGWLTEPRTATADGDVRAAAIALATAALRHLPLAGEPWRLRVDLAADGDSDRPGALRFLDVVPLALEPRDPRRPATTEPDLDAVAVTSCLAAALGAAGSGPD